MNEQSEKGLFNVGEMASEIARLEQENAELRENLEEE